MPVLSIDALGCVVHVCSYAMIIAQTPNETWKASSFLRDKTLLSLPFSFYLHLLIFCIHYLENSVTKKKVKHYK